MNLTEQVEEALEEEKATTNEAPKTWNTAEVVFLNQLSCETFLSSKSKKNIFTSLSCSYALVLYKNS